MKHLLLRMSSVLTLGTLLSLTASLAQADVIETKNGARLTGKVVKMDGTTLTLETEGPNCTGGGGTSRYRDVIALAGPDERTLTSLALQPDGANPVAYDPCRPIHYVTRPGGPPEGDVLIREALASVSTATGLRFVDDGATEEAPSDDRAPHQPDVYGDRWAPVLFAWSDPVESPRLGEIDPDQPQADPAAYAGSTGVTWEPAGASSRMVYVTGSVTLDGPDLTDISEGPDGRARALAIIEHEVGHLVGLGHVDDDETRVVGGQIGLPVIDDDVGHALRQVEVSERLRRRFLVQRVHQQLVAGQRKQPVA